MRAQTVRSIGMSGEIPSRFKAGEVNTNRTTRKKTELIRALAFSTDELDRARRRRNAPDRKARTAQARCGGSHLFCQRAEEIEHLGWRVYGEHRTWRCRVSLPVR